MSRASPQPLPLRRTVVRGEYARRLARGSKDALNQSSSAARALVQSIPGACAALALGACSLLPAPQAHVSYTLPAAASAQGSRAAAHATAPLPAAAWSLRVYTPTAVAPLDSPWVIVEHPNATLASYHGIRWVDRAPVLLRERLVQRFGSSGLFAAVVSDDAMAPSDVDLSLQLHAFQLHDPAGQARVLVRLQAQLIDGKSARLMGDQTFVQTQVVDDPRNPDAVIAAFGGVADAVADAMAAWLEPLVRARANAEVTP